MCDLQGKYEAKGSGLQYCRIRTSAEQFCRNSFTRPTPRPAFLPLVLCRLFSAKAVFGKQWNGTKGFWGSERRLFQSVSWSLSFPLLSPLWNPGAWTQDLISYQGASSAQVLYMSTSDLGSRGQISWILDFIYLSNRDKNHPTCRAGVVCVTNSRECVLQMLMVGIETNNISFLFLHSLHQKKNSKHIWIYTSERVSYLLSTEFARGTENWELLFFFLLVDLTTFLLEFRLWSYWVRFTVK